MDLVNELQTIATSGDVLTVLRTARRCASKLGLTDIDGWLRREQEGYSSDDKVPEYRVIKGKLAYQTNGYIPMGYGMVGKGLVEWPGNLMIPTPIRNSASEIIHMLAEEKGLIIALDDKIMGDFFKQMDEDIADQVSFVLKLNPGVVAALLESVKDKVLAWACELERKGIRGHNMTFSVEEKQKASGMTVNNYGNTTMNTVAGNQGPVAITTDGQVSQQTGDNSKMLVGPPKSKLFKKAGVAFGKLWAFIKLKLGF